MANLSLSNLRTELRRRLDEITLSGESTSKDSDIESGGASNFSDNDLDERLLNGARFLAARVKSEVLPNLVNSVDPTSSFDLDTILRVRGSRIEVNGNIATRRTFEADRQNSARPASDNNPTYSYEDADLLLRDGGGVASTGEGSDNLNDISPSVGVVDNVTAVSDLTDVFRNSVILYAAAMCQATLNSDLYSTLIEKALVNIQSHLRPLAANDSQ